MRRQETGNRVIPVNKKQNNDDDIPVVEEIRTNTGKQNRRAQKTTYIS
jgi:hypothetical protein